MSLKELRVKRQGRRQKRLTRQQWGERMRRIRRNREMRQGQ